MSRSLKSFAERDKMLAISRRLKQGLADNANRGAGFWAAYDAIRHYPAASLTLEVRGTYLDIEKQLNKGGQNEKPKSRSRKNVKRFKRVGSFKDSVFSRGQVSPQTEKAPAIN